MEMRTFHTYFLYYRIAGINTVQYSTVQLALFQMAIDTKLASSLCPLALLPGGVGRQPTSRLDRPLTSLLGVRGTRVLDMLQCVTGEVGRIPLKTYLRSVILVCVTSKLFPLPLLDVTHKSPTQETCSVATTSMLPRGFRKNNKNSTNSSN